MYNNMDRIQLENPIGRNMILKDKIFDTIKGQIPKDLYNRLMNRKSKIVEEEKKMRINMVKMMCIVNNDEEMEEILKGIEILLRNKKRSILLMGGNYEEVKMETKKAIIAYMTSILKKSAQTKVASPTMSAQPKQAKEAEMSS